MLIRTYPFRSRRYCPTALLPWWRSSVDRSSYTVKELFQIRRNSRSLATLAPFSLTFKYIYFLNLSCTYLWYMPMIHTHGTTYGTYLWYVPMAPTYGTYLVHTYGTHLWNIPMGHIYEITDVSNYEILLFK